MLSEIAGNREKDGRPIAFFVPRLNGGGAQRVVVNLANALAAKVERPIHIVLAAAEGPFLKEVSGDVKVVDLKTARASRSVFALSSYIRRHNPCVLCATLDYANIVAVIAHAMAGVKVRLVLREANVVRVERGRRVSQVRQRIRIYAMRVLYPRADCCVAISEEVLASMLRAGLRIADRAVIISNPLRQGCVETHAFSPPWLPEPKPRFICSVGRLSEQKGFDVLLEAFALCQDQNLHLVIMGEGRLYDCLRKQSRRLNVQDRVHLPGFVSDPMEILASASAFVSSSRWEGVSNSLLEALQCGVSIVATDCPGATRTLLEGGRYGHLVPVDDPAALAEGIIRAISQPAGTPEGRKRKAQEFAPHRIAEQYLEEAFFPVGTNG